MIIQICVGSACHLKGSEKLVGLFEDALKKYDLENDVTLAGSFCTGRCNRDTGDSWKRRIHQTHPCGNREIGEIIYEFE